MRGLKRFLALGSFSAFLLLTPLTSFAQTAQDQQDAEQLLSKLQSLPAELLTRLNFASAYLLGRPYLEGGPLGEGSSGVYDQDPLYRMDGFDCTTFVETSLAFARAHDLNDFINELLHIRYLHGNVSYPTRNHFVELDWRPNNIAAGFLEEFSNQVGSLQDRSNAIQTFSKRAWYAAKTMADLRLPYADAATLASRLNSLQHEGNAFPDETSKLPSVLKSSLLTVQNELPDSAVLNIVRDLPGPSNDPVLHEVTHQVLLLKIAGQFHIREASSKAGIMKVVDFPYAEYVQSLIESPSTKGVNILKLLPRN